MFDGGIFFLQKKFWFLYSSNFYWSFAKNDLEKMENFFAQNKINNFCVYSNI